MSGKGKMTIDPPVNGPMGRFARLVITLLVLLGILLVFIIFGARTEYARRLIEDQVYEMIGVRVTIEKARIGLPYDLVVEDMVSKNFGGEDQPWFQVQELRLGLGVRTTWRLSIHRATLHATWENREQAQPEFLHRLANLKLDDIEEISRCTMPIRRGYAILLTDSSIEWKDRRGNPVGGMTGIGFQLRPVDIPGHAMYYHSLVVYQATGPECEGLSGYKREWLVEGDRPMIEIGGLGDRPAEPMAPAPRRFSFDTPPPGVPPGMKMKLPNVKRDRRSAEE